MRNYRIFLLFVFVVGAQTIYGQWVKDNELKQTIKIHTDTSVIIFDVLEEELTIHPRENRTYYWYANRKIMANQGGVGGLLLDGPYSQYNNDDRLIEKGNFKNGLKKGTWKLWDSSGNSIRIEKYRKGLLNGKQIVFNQGQIVQIKWFRKGIEIPNRWTPVFMVTHTNHHDMDINEKEEVEKKFNNESSNGEIEQ